MERSEIHLWALGGAAAAAALPVGLDAIALIAEECTMIMRIGSNFGRNITKTIAESLLASEFASIVGSAAYVAFMATFESLNIGYPFTIPAKGVPAAGMIELIGNAAYSYYAKDIQN